jgi:hypothetical protein
VALVLVLLAYPAGASHAEEAYKSVDAEGHVVYSDQADPSTAPQSVVPIDVPTAPPRVIHFCWTNCFTLQWNQGVYTRVDGSDETWTIERFTSQSFRLHRHDEPAAWNGFRADVAYEGRVSDGRVSNVMVDGRPVSEIAVAWGAALASLPGSNAERDQRNATLNAEVRVPEAPPPLPDYQQPPCPAEGYLWTPGYWAWGSAGYYWSPGLWVQPPRVGVLWTPGYWGLVDAVYVFHPGYWGPHVGYYGGINYGYGYAGVGFAGGRWVGGSFAYNRAVSNVNANLVHNSYSAPVPVSAAINKVSYNGGPGGTTAAPSPQERAAAAEARTAPSSAQGAPQHAAATSPAQLAHVHVNHPPIPATPRPAVFHAPPRLAAAQTAKPRAAAAPPTPLGHPRH